MKYKLIIFAINKEGLNGDRSYTNTPYKDYKIVLQDITKKGNHCVELAYISGHDKWWRNHRKEKEVLTELGQIIEKFEKFFNIKAENFNLVKKVTITEEWVEDEKI